MTFVLFGTIGFVVAWIADSARRAGFRHWYLVLLVPALIILAMWWSGE